MSDAVVFCHLLNDYSGSPKVLRQSIAACSGRGWPVRLFVGTSGRGVLSITGLRTTRYPYSRSRRRILTLFSYLFSQLALLVMLLLDRSIPRDAVVYVNTLLPFGGAVYGKLTGRRVIWHVHEIAITPAPLRSMLLWFARRTAALVLFVSDAHAAALPVRGAPFRRVHNALDPRFLASAAASRYAHRRDGAFNVLMVASLRDYKGVPELVRLASSLSHRADVRFELVLNDERPAVDRYFAGTRVPENLVLHPRAADVAPFYARASLLLNLSRVDLWVETFGLTILEAMAFGVPVIAPPVGGPPELVRDGVEGYLLDSRDEETVRRRVLELCDDEQVCIRMSRAGRERAAEFTPSLFADQIAAAIDSIRRNAV